VNPLLADLVQSHIDAAAAQTHDADARAAKIEQEYNQAKPEAVKAMRDFGSASATRAGAYAYRNALAKAGITDKEELAKADAQVAAADVAYNSNSDIAKGFGFDGQYGKQIQQTFQAIQSGQANVDVGADPQTSGMQLPTNSAPATQPAATGYGSMQNSPYYQNYYNNGGTSQQ
jgi:multidrug resistance efflux pump